MSAPPVMVAMSGGVDSSVAAALLLGEGREVVGVTLRLWGGESDSGCCAVSSAMTLQRCMPMAFAFASSVSAKGWSRISARC